MKGPVCRECGTEATPSRAFTTSWVCPGGGGCPQAPGHLGCGLVEKQFSNSMRMVWKCPSCGHSFQDPSSDPH